MKFLRLLSALSHLALLLSLFVIDSDAAAQNSSSLLSRTPPLWHFTNWINSSPLTLGDLYGKVVLVRWWTAPGCPYCAATAPALNEFDSLYRSRGLCIVGAYHEKSGGPARAENVKRYAKKFGFEFPVAIDPQWRTLHEWWLDRGEHDFTSATFLIDRRGIVRFIHPGGEYVKGDKDYAAIRSKIEQLLEQK